MAIFSCPRPMQKKINAIFFWTSAPNELISASSKNHGRNESLARAWDGPHEVATTFNINSSWSICLRPYAAGTTNNNILLFMLVHHSGYVLPRTCFRRTALLDDGGRATISKGACRTLVEDDSFIILDKLHPPGPNKMDLFRCHVMCT